MKTIYEYLPYYKLADRVFQYNPITGELTYKKDSYRKKKGDKVGCVSESNKYNRLTLRLDGKSKTFYAHRIIWFIVFGEVPNVIDHIDGNGKNNKLDNLRNGTHQENTFNAGASKNNSSGYKGVSFDKSRNKWLAQIGIDNQRKFIGRFSSAKDASDAYENQAKKLFKGLYNAR